MSRTVDVTLGALDRPRAAPSLPLAAVTGHTPAPEVLVLWDGTVRGELPAGFHLAPRGALSDPGGTASLVELVAERRRQAPLVVVPWYGIEPGILRQVQLAVRGWGPDHAVAVDPTPTPSAAVATGLALHELLRADALPLAAVPAVHADVTARSTTVVVAARPHRSTVVDLTVRDLARALLPGPSVLRWPGDLRLGRHVAIRRRRPEDLAAAMDEALGPAPDPCRLVVAGRPAPTWPRFEVEATMTVELGAGSLDEAAWGQRPHLDLTRSRLLPDRVRRTDHLCPSCGHLVPPAAFDGYSCVACLLP